MSWASCEEDSFIELAYWLDQTGPDDEHPELAEDLLEELQEQEASRISEEFWQNAVGQAEYNCEGDR
jgi:hypothetical protein